MRLSLRKFPWLLLALAVLGGLGYARWAWYARGRPHLRLPGGLPAWSPDCPEWTAEIEEFGTGTPGAEAMGTEWLLTPDADWLALRTFPNLRNVVAPTTPAGATQQVVRQSTKELAQALPDISLGDWRILAYAAEGESLLLLVYDPSQHPRQFALTMPGAPQPTPLPVIWPSGKHQGQAIGWDDLWSTPEGPVWLFGRLIDPESGAGPQAFALRWDGADPFAAEPTLLEQTGFTVLALPDPTHAIAAADLDGHYWRLDLESGVAEGLEPGPGVPAYGGRTRGPAPGEALDWPTENAGELTYARSAPIPADLKDVVLDGDRQWRNPPVALVTEAAWAEPSGISSLDLYAMQHPLPGWLRQRSVGLMAEELEGQREEAWQSLAIGERWLFWKDAAGVPHQAALPEEVTVGTQYTLALTRSTGLGLTAIDAVTPVLLQTVVRQSGAAEGNVLRLGLIDQQSGALDWRGYIALPAALSRGVPGLEIRGRMIGETLCLTIESGTLGADAGETRYWCYRIPEIKAKLGRGAG